MFFLTIILGVDTNTTVTECETCQVRRCGWLALPLLVLPVLAVDTEHRVHLGVQGFMRASQNLGSILCTVYCVLCTVYCVLCTVYCVLCNVHFQITWIMITKNSRVSTNEAMGSRRVCIQNCQWAGIGRIWSWNYYQRLNFLGLGS